MSAQETSIKINCLTIPTQKNVVSLYRNSDSTQYYARYESADGTPIDESYWLASPTFKNSEEFYSYAEKLLQHEEQLSHLSRPCKEIVTQTPWGTGYESQLYADGIIFYRTASHGGFYISPIMNKSIHYLYRNPNLWYEEDVEAFKVIASFPDLFTDLEKSNADTVLKNFFPFSYEKINNISLSEGESFIKDQEAFFYAHRYEWIGYRSAPISGRDDVVQVTAVLGGKNRKMQNKHFEVPLSEYLQRSRFGILIDPKRHIEIVKH